jgi:hypothetical protein
MADEGWVPVRPVWRVRRQPWLVPLVLAAVVASSVIPVVTSPTWQKPVWAAVGVLVVWVIGRQILRARRNDPVLWVSDAGVRRPDGDILPWQDCKGVVIYQPGQPMAALVPRPKTAGASRHWLDSLWTGYPIWTLVPLRTSPEDRELLARLFDQNEIGVLKPHGLRRLFRWGSDGLEP